MRTPPVVGCASPCHSTAERQWRARFAASRVSSFHRRRLGLAQPGVDLAGVAGRPPARACGSSPAGRVERARLRRRPSPRSPARCRGGSRRTGTRRRGLTMSSNAASTASPSTAQPQAAQAGRVDQHAAGRHHDQLARRRRVPAPVVVGADRRGREAARRRAARWPASTCRRRTGPAAPRSWPVPAARRRCRCRRRVTVLTACTSTPDEAVG